MVAITTNSYRHFYTELMSEIKMRQLVAGTVAVIFCMGALAGCGNNTSKPKPSESPQSQASVSTSPDPAIAARAAVTYILDCAGEPVARPDQLTLTCADGNEMLDQLVWSDWGQDQAQATGQLTTNTCEPNCANGSTLVVPVKVTASGLVEGEASATYGTIDVTIKGNVPAGLQRHQGFKFQTVSPVK